MTKHETILEWFKGCPYIPLHLYFNAVQGIDSCVSLVTEASDNTIVEYIDGTSIKQYNIALVHMQSNDIDGTSDTNISNLIKTDSIREWIEQQNKAKKFPDLGDNCTVTDVKALQDMPNLAYTTETGIAKYIIQVRFDYIELPKE